MAEVEISYKGSNIATMNASGTKTLLTEAKYLEDDVTITYARPYAPSGTKNISITQNGTTTEDVTSYASAEITVAVPNPSTGTLNITAPGTYNVTNYASVEVDIDMWTEQTISTAGAVTQALSPYVIYHFTGELTSLTVTLAAAAQGQIPHYHFDFASGSTAPTLTLPQTVTMPSGFSVEASKHYEIDILNNYGTAMGW